MKNNKLISVLIALLVCLTVVVSASATEPGENGLIFSLNSASVVSDVDAAVVKTNEELTIEVKIDNNPGILAAIIRINYDPEKLELKSVTSLNSVLAHSESYSQPGSIVINYGDLQKAIMDSAYPTTNLTGVVLNIKFKAIAEADAADAVSLNASSIVTRNENKAVVTLPNAEAKISLHVVGNDHDHANYETIEKGNAVAPDCVNAGKHTDLLCAHCGEVAQEGAPIDPNGHGETEIKDAKAATCVADGYTGDTYCKVCDEKIADGEVIPALGHTETEVKDAAEATCTEAGYTGDTYCKVCSEKIAEGEAIKALGHTYVDKVIEPTCGDKGYTEHTCSACGDVKKDTVTDPTGEHTWGEWATTKEPTCGEDGEQKRECTVCDGYEEKLLERTGAHEWDEANAEITKAPTCSENGEQKLKCKNCNFEKVDSNVPPTGEHTWGEWSTTKEATVEAEGEQARSCSVCGEKETKVIEKLPEPANNTVVIVVVIVVTLLAAAGVATYFVLKNKKAK